MLLILVFILVILKPKTRSLRQKPAFRDDKKTCRPEPKGRDLGLLLILTFILAILKPKNQIPQAKIHLSG